MLKGKFSTRLLFFFFKVNFTIFRRQLFGYLVTGNKALTTKIAYSVKKKVLPRVRKNGPAMLVSYFGEMFIS